MSLGPQPEPPTGAQRPATLLQETADGPMTLQGHTHKHAHAATHTQTAHTHISASRQMLKFQAQILMYIFTNIK